MLFEYFWKAFETLWNVLRLLLENLWNMFGMRFRIWTKMRLDKNAEGSSVFVPPVEMLSDSFWSTNLEYLLEAR